MASDLVLTSELKRTLVGDGSLSQSEKQKQMSQQEENPSRLDLSAWTVMKKISLGLTGASCGCRRKDTRMEGSHTKGRMSKLERNDILAALLATEITLKNTSE